MKRLILLAALFGCATSPEGAIPAEPEPITADPACEQDFCDYEGWCSDIGGTCIATLPEHCTRSQVCASNGCCTLDSGDCVCTQEDTP